MRTQFVETDSYAAASAACPWATKIVKVEGGYWCFESLADYETWQRQR